MEQCLRTFKSSLDERMGVKIDVLHPVLTWLCEFVGYMMNRMEVASDGKTPCQRVKGKRSKVMGLEFCVKVLWKDHPGKGMAKFDARWGYGLFLGVRSRSGELIVVDGESKEVKYVRTVKRIPEEHGGTQITWSGSQWFHGTEEVATRRLMETCRSSM